MSRKDRPIYTDEHGVHRFKGNGIVRELVDAAQSGRKYDLNQIAYDVASGKFSHADKQELYQLIGYSLSGYADIFPSSKLRTPPTTGAPTP